VEGVADAQGDGVTFAPAQERRRQRVVDDDAGARTACEIHRYLANAQVEVRAGQDGGTANLRTDGRQGGRAPGSERGIENGGDAAGRKTVHEAPARSVHALRLRTRGYRG